MRFIILVALLLLPRLANAEVAVRSTILHGGQERIHYFFKPKQVVEPPLIVVLHGMGGNAKNLRFGIGMTDRAALAGMSVVFPQGVRLPGGARHWNAGFRFSNTDDVGYLTTLIRSLQDEHGVSRENVFILGLSMGGYMAYHMACRTEIPIRAIASVTGTMGGATWANCPAPAKPSILHLHGRNDPKVRFDGGVRKFGGGGAPSIPAIAEFWARRLGARAVAPAVRTPGVTEWHYRNDESGDVVRLIALEGFGHDWPSPKTAGYDALATIIGFFQMVRRPVDVRHAKATRPAAHADRPQ